MHRRAISCAVLDTVAAVGTSLATPVAQASDDTTRTTIRIQPGELRRGADAAVLHSTGSTIHFGNRDIRTDLPGPLDVVGRGDGGVVVVARDQLYHVQGDGSATRIARLPASATSVEVSTDGSRVAYAWRRHGHVKITVEKTATGRRLSIATLGSRVELAGYAERRLLLSTWTPGRTFWYAPATGDRTVLARRYALDVDIAHDRIGFAVPDPNGYDGFCARFSRISHPQSSTWYTCKHTPLAWSTDGGGRVLTVDIRTDGLGPGTVQMRKVDGTLLRTFRSGLFGDVRFVTRHTVLLSTQGARQAALVRCTLEGGGAHCTRSTRLRPAHDLGPNDALRLSMPD